MEANYHLNVQSAAQLSGPLILVLYFNYVFNCASERQDLLGVTEYGKIISVCNLLSAVF